MTNLQCVNALILIGWGLIGFAALIVAQHEMNRRIK
jgi:hypothetical protein